ncbi:MAG: dihydrodipicolinate synthase family protein [Candidatus Competibacterales bacterium]|nr:dihydrodipicolinate synthase family protein [Candidatus Competibacterales bacterium]
MHLEGIYTPVITPFGADEAIDEPGFAALVEHLIEAGVHGIIVGGTTGEYYALSLEERIRSFQLAQEIIHRRLPLIAGVNALRTEEAIELGRAARAAGADAILLGSPYYALPTERELSGHCLAVDQAVNLPIVLYNYPARAGVGMGEEFLARVGRSPNFCAIKESSGDINRLHLLARDYPHIQTSCGMDDQALEFFTWGASSWICGASNFLPEEHLTLYRACVVEKDFDRGRAIMCALMPLMRLLEQGGQFIQCIKYGCELQGLPAGPVRKPLGALDEALQRDGPTRRGSRHATRIEHARSALRVARDRAARNRIESSHGQP